MPSLLKSYGNGSTESGTPSRSVSLAGGGPGGGVGRGACGTGVPARIRPVTSAYRYVVALTFRDPNRTRSIAGLVRGLTSPVRSTFAAAHSPEAPSTLGVLGATPPRWPGVLGGTRGIAPRPTAGGLGGPRVTGRIPPAVLIGTSPASVSPSHDSV